LEIQTRTTKAPSARIAGLDGLRGLAALLVLLNHMSLNGLFLLPGLDFIGLGKPAVYLFFNLSAFLLTSQLWNWTDERLRSPRCWLGYLTGRVFRIWPLFMLYVITSFLTSEYGPAVLRGQGLPETISAQELIQTLSLQRGQGTVLWTIPVEFKFYLLLPAIILILTLVLRRSIVQGSILVALSAAACFALIPPASWGASPTPFLGVFLTGVLAALTHQSLIRRTRPISPALFERLAWLAALALVLITPAVARQFTGMTVPGEYLSKALLPCSILWFVMILGMLHGTGMMRRLLDLKTFVGLGTVSYSLYLCHMTVLKITVWPKLPLGPYARAWLSVAAAIALAAASFAIVEAPGISLGARVRRLLIGGQAPAGS